MASNTSSSRGVHASTVVVSLMTKGHSPIEWWIWLPGSGQFLSTARIRLFPTTHCE
ncbi:hypothetical protein HLY00_2863 [Mycolicibacterium hippocampi]|uniref:Uncharacterized protein n=1 Tax=Mycolicibacterium hippocampi TaxID=659824 RepID=A0A850PXM3_9MYCO|nr:hypothetical protein [Mycolicibacterium hippocampi]